MSGAQSRLYIGLISGTSVDGLDAALINVQGDGAIELIDAVTLPFDDDLAAAITDLISNAGGSFDAVGAADANLAEACASACKVLLERSGKSAANIAAIGSHGQTVWHDTGSEPPFTIQLGDPGRIAARTGITVVGDFRRVDVALGGEGAPLVPPFHAAAFGRPDERRAIVNLGGIANVTVLECDAAGMVNGVDGAEGSVRGFDCGPANALLDAWHARHRDGAVDRAGAWARSGRVSNALLERMLTEAFFAEAPPKSTGKELFRLAWIDAHLTSLPETPSLADVQATLAELTARTVADAIGRHAPGTQRVLLCGGGVHNEYLVERLGVRLGHVPVETTAQHGIDPDHVEAAAFAWLAHRRLASLPGAYASVTGASRDSVAGGIYRDGKKGGS